MINFYRGLREKYDIQIHGNGVYFALDTLEIIHNGYSYSGVSSSKSVANIILEGNNFIITYTDNTTDTIEINKYYSNISDENLGMPAAVGGINKGTTVKALNGKTYNEILDDLLFPTMNPTNSAISVSGFVLASSGPIRLGSDVVSVSEAGLNRGKWNEYNNNAPYAGEVTSINYTFTINGNTYNNISDLLGKTYNTLGNHTYKAVVNYAAGQAPKNNKGIEVPNLACPAGSKEVTRTINVTAPWFASTQAAGMLAEQSLISWNNTPGAMTTPEFTLQPHTPEDPQIFKVPRQVIGPKALGRLQMFSTVSGKFENVDIADWEETVSTENIEGTDQTYYTYAYKGNARGSVKLIVKF